MKTVRLLLLALTLPLSALMSATLDNHPRWKSESLPGLYYEVLAAAVEKEAALQAPDGRFRQRQPESAGDKELSWRVTGMQFIYAAALLYASAHPSNPLHGDRKVLEMAFRAGDYLAGCVEKDGTVVPRINGVAVEPLDAHRSLYCWTEALGLLEKDLDSERREAWRSALRRAGEQLLATEVAPKISRPRYTSPFLGFSPNHMGLRLTTVWRMGMVLGIPEWVELTQPAIRRFVNEIHDGGYWAEHDGPTMSYDYLNGSVAGLYWIYSGDPAALRAMRLNTDYHTHWATPDGVDIHTIDQRNRNHFEVNASFGLFAFCYFPDGRRFARFKILAALGDTDDPLKAFGLEELGRVAQAAHYHTEGPEAPIPQEYLTYHHSLDRPAVVKKSGPWVYSISAILSPERPLSQFYLDRTAPISLWHGRTRHIIAGGNSKGQPELATFAVKRLATGEWSRFPLDALIQSNWDADTLCVAQEGFSLRLAITPEDSSRATIAVQAESTYNTTDSCFFNFPLILSPGNELRSGAGKSYKLGTEEIRLTGKSLGGALACRGWEVALPPEAEFLWPFYTYSPYGAERVPKNLEAAVGVVRIPLSGNSEWITVKFSVK